MKRSALRQFLLFAFSCMMSISAFAQVIEGDRMLDLLNKPVYDPAFQALRKQENYTLNAFSADWSLYTIVRDTFVRGIEFENGRTSSSSMQYGVYKKKLPFALSWDVAEATLRKRFGAPIDSSIKYQYKEYLYNHYRLKFQYDGTKITSIKVARPGKEQGAARPPAGMPLVKLQSRAEAANWSVLSYIINSFPNLMNITAADSTDYLAEVFYKTAYPTDGAECTAIKRKKRDGQTWYESFFKITSKDTVLVRDIFAGLYQSFDKTIKLYAPKDFTFSSVTDDNFKQGSMNWMARWTLNDGYQNFRPGLGKVQINMLLNGQTDFLDPSKINYTIKLDINDRYVSYDFFTWDKPR